MNALMSAGHTLAPVLASHILAEACAGVRRLAAQLLHDDEEVFSVLAQLVDLHDVGLRMPAAILASSRNIPRNSASRARCGSMRLTTTARTKPLGPESLPRKSSAMPPVAMRPTIS